MKRVKSQHLSLFKSWKCKWVTFMHHRYVNRFTDLPLNEYRLHCDQYDWPCREWTSNSRINLQQFFCTLKSSELEIEFTLNWHWLWAHKYEVLEVSCSNVASHTERREILVSGLLLEGRSSQADGNNGTTYFAFLLSWGARKYEMSSNCLQLRPVFSKEAAIETKCVIGNWGFGYWFRFWNRALFAVYWTFYDAEVDKYRAIKCGNTIAMEMKRETTARVAWV